MINALAAAEAGADRLHGTFLGVGERVGNAEMDLLLINFQLLGWGDFDLARLPEICELVARATGVPLPENYPVVGRDAFRTGTGVHAAAIIKARAKGDDWLADRIYSGVPASLVGRRQLIEVGPMSGESNVVFWLREHGIEPTSRARRGGLPARQAERAAARGDRDPRDLRRLWCARRRLRRRRRGGDRRGARRGAEDAVVILERFVVGPFAENTYLIGVPPRVAVVDPGGESEAIARTIEERGWTVEGILLTHGHIDHIAHVAPLAERFGVGCRIHQGDDFLLRVRQMPEIEPMLGFRRCPDPQAYLGDGETLEVAGLTLQVLHTPGHSPGGVCFVDEASREILVGDTIFQRGIGRTDLPGGDYETLGRSIRERLFALPGEWTLYPGHGPATTLDEERRENPFFGAQATA